MSNGSSPVIIDFFRVRSWNDALTSKNTARLVDCGAAVSHNEPTEASLQRRYHRWSSGHPALAVLEASKSQRTRRPWLLRPEGYESIACSAKARCLGMTASLLALAIMYVSLHLYVV